MAHQFNFGTGKISALPVGGGAPIPFGTLQGASLDFEADNKQLYGSSQYPDDVATGKRKITGKLTLGRVDFNLFNQLFFGGSVTSGQVVPVIQEAHSVAATSPYTFTAANGANYGTDLGVTYAGSGIPLTQVSTTPTLAGTYQVSASGVYTFSAADSGAAMMIDYTYAAAGQGQTLAVTNSLMGSINTFQLNLFNIYKTKALNMVLYSCVSNKFSLPMKQDDYTNFEADFMAYADGSGRVYNVSWIGG